MAFSPMQEGRVAGRGRIIRKTQAQPLLVSRSGRARRRLYRLTSGCLRLSTEGGVILDYLRPGAFFGEKALLKGRAKPQTAESVSAATIAVYPVSDLRRLIEREPTFVLDLLTSLAERIDRYEQTIGSFVTDNAVRRLAAALGRLAPPRPASGWVRLELSPTNPELARMVGTTRWRVSLHEPVPEAGLAAPARRTLDRAPGMAGVPGVRRSLKAVAQAAAALQ